MMFSEVITAFDHKKMKAGRSSYDCGDVSVTTARSGMSKNCLRKPESGIVLT